MEIKHPSKNMTSQDVAQTQDTISWSIIMVGSDSDGNMIPLRHELLAIARTTQSTTVRHHLVEQGEASGLATLVHVATPAKPKRKQRGDLRQLRAQNKQAQRAQRHQTRR